jgi:hypothetical protein
MLELIGSILLVYYLMLGVAVLIFLAWGYLDDRRQANQLRRKTRTRDGTRAQPRWKPEGDLHWQAEPTGHLPDNVVRFKRR